MYPPIAPILFIFPFLFFFLLLLVPIDLEGRVVLGERPNIRIGWLFGLIRKDLFDEITAEEETSEESEGAQERVAQKLPDETLESKDGCWNCRDILSIIRTKGLIGNLKRLLKGLARALWVQHLCAHLQMGFEDPADTGQAAGYLWSAIGYLESLYPLDVKIEPSFYEVVLEGEGEGTLRIWPLLVVLPLLRFILSGPTLKATWKVIKIRRKKN